jgi:hypothetical protein
VTGVVTKQHSASPDFAAAEGLSELSLEDTLAQKMRGVAVKSRPAVAGYNPYDAEPAGRSKEQRKPTDLRKLSEWILTQRKVEQLKKQNC